MTEIQKCEMCGCVEIEPMWSEFGDGEIYCCMKCAKCRKMGTPASSEGPDTIEAATILWNIEQDFIADGKKWRARHAK